MRSVKKQYNILMVDDHPLIIDGYKNALDSLNDENFTFNITTAYNCDDALYRINAATARKPYHFFFLDINLPASKDEKFKSGTDLAIYAKKKFPQSKIVILTMLEDDFRINHILSKLNPDGMLIKNDIDLTEFLHAFKLIEKGRVYYSSSILDLLSRLNFKVNTEQLDATDIEIVSLIAQGVKTIDLPNFVNLSLSSIEKRKKNIKKTLKLGKANDTELVNKAKSIGIIS